MKTKYIKVEVSERLPKTADYYITDIGYVAYSIVLSSFVNEYGENDITVEWWLEEIPDREEEMIEMLEECRLQLEHVNRLNKRGTTNSIMSRLETLLQSLKQEK